jgi:fimbrial chaperone protein
MQRRFLPLVLAAGVTLVVPVRASSFRVTPTQVDLASPTASALVTLYNEAKTALRFEISVFSWSEDERGVMDLKPSTAVTFFPKLVELPAGASRNIRIGFSGAAPRDVEQTYRLFVEEMPNTSKPAGNAVAIRTRIGIPVFVRPADPKRSATIDGVTIEGGRVLTRVKNTGNLHVSVDNVAVKGLNAGGTQTFTHDGAGWYVLPGATRVFEVPLSAAECSSAASVAVEVVGHGTSLKSTGTVSPAACKPR